MLVLSRLVGQEIVIGDEIRVRISAVKGQRVRIAIEAPDSVSIYRQEIAHLRDEFRPQGIFDPGYASSSPETLFLGHDI